MSISQQYSRITGRSCLYYIAHIDNLPSILNLGILSHNAAQAVNHSDISLTEVQDLRANVLVDSNNNRWLHQYANLYMDARNPMMYRRSRIDGWHHQLCVLHIDCGVLDLPDTVVSDFNAAAISLARFRNPVEAIPLLPYNEIFAEWWTHEDPRLTKRHRARKCAEVLIYKQVPSHFIIGMSVCDSTVLESDSVIAPPSLPCFINPHMFFFE